MMADPLGGIVTSGGDEESILQVEIEPKKASDVRKESPALSDRVL
jgi:predicted amidohydrolase